MEILVKYSNTNTSMSLDVITNTAVLISYLLLIKSFIELVKYIKTSAPI